MDFEVNDLEIDKYKIIFKNNEKQLILSIITECCEEAYFKKISNKYIPRLEQLGFKINEDNFIPLKEIITYKIISIKLIFRKETINKKANNKYQDDICLEYKLYEINLNNNKKSYIILKVISNGYYSSILNTKIKDI